MPRPPQLPAAPLAIVDEVVYGCDRDARGWSPYSWNEAETRLCTFLIGNGVGSVVAPLVGAPSQASAIEAAWPRRATAVDSFGDDRAARRGNVMLQWRPVVLSGFPVVRVAFGGPSRRFLGSTA